MGHMQEMLKRSPTVQALAQRQPEVKQILNDPKKLQEEMALVQRNLAALQKAEQSMRNPRLHFLSSCMCTGERSVCKLWRRIPSPWLSIELAFAAQRMHARTIAVSSTTKCYFALRWISVSRVGNLGQLIWHYDTACSSMQHRRAVPETRPRNAWTGLVMLLVDLRYRRVGSHFMLFGPRLNWRWCCFASAK